jgi:ATP-dependent helicase/nuclease subunit A
MTDQRRLDFDAADEAGDPLLARDRAARVLATDPRRNVALEASAGTGKTRVLVDRYVRLVVEAEVHPRHILAMTFTRKAAAEMRQRVLETLRTRHREGALTSARWRAIRDAIPDITIGTIDAFCLSLLHEFPLEAGVDPAFDLADETETPRLVNGAIDRALRAGRGLTEQDADVALVFADLGEMALRRGLSVLLDRRLVAGPALSRFVRASPTTTENACARLLAALRQAFAAVPGGLAAFLRRGPLTPAFVLLAADLEPLASADTPTPERLRAALDRLCAHVLTTEGVPRQRLAQKKAEFRSAADYDAHKIQVFALGPPVAEALTVFRRDLNLVLARGVQRLFAVASSEYRRALDKHGVLDFSDVLERALALLEQRDEFSRSRFKLESRYRHVLVDEFQDTSRAQWRLVRELMSSWSEGAGIGEDRVPPSIFIVGDRKQSIYGFRDAEVAVLEEAARHIDALRPELPARAAITRSHRAVLPLLRFVNDVCDAVQKQPDRPDAFRYSDDDRFPLTHDAAEAPHALGVVATRSDVAQAEAIGDEIARVLSAGVTVRDRTSGVARPVGPGDIAVLFRTREGHRLIEGALASRGVPFYVYKGLGFFDADEIRDALALLAYLADPASSLRAAAVLRSRFVRVSDAALAQLAPDLAGALSDAGPPVVGTLDEVDARRLQLARTTLTSWRGAVDRVPPAELLDRVLAESAYARELAGPGLAQARENLKKIRGLVRRLQNRGYATLDRIVDHLSQLVAGGDESNAIIDAVDAVNLMTVHAAKGLEFPIVWVVHVGRGSGGGRDPIRVVVEAGADGDAPPEVGIGDHDTPADADASARDAEEGKRLLYVALTRARDRLYLAGVMDESGRLGVQRGSLAQHLPASLLDALAGAATAADLTWVGPTASHTLQVVPGSGDTPVRWSAVPADAPAPIQDLAPLPGGGTSRITVASEAADSAPPSTHGARGTVPVSEKGTVPASDARSGRLVHALMARGFRHRLDETGLRRLAGEIARDESLEGEAATVERAFSMAARLLASDAFQVGPDAEVHFEVPYSRRLPAGEVERGILDVLIVSPSEVVVLEIKTGAAVPAHRLQLDAYVAAARAAYPTRRVVGRLVYAAEA